MSRNDQFNSEFTLMKAVTPKTHQIEQLLKEQGRNHNESSFSQAALLKRNNKPPHGQRQDANHDSQFITSSNE